jgi:hypothetical protein
MFKRGSGINSNIPCKSALRFEPIHHLVFEARFEIFRIISIGNLSVCSIHEQFDYLLFASTSLVVVKSKHNVLTSSPRFRHVFELFQVLVIFCIDGFQISKYDGPSKNVLVNNVFCQASTVVISWLSIKALPSMMRPKKRNHKAYKIWRLRFVPVMSPFDYFDQKHQRTFNPQLFVIWRLFKSHIHHHSKRFV